MRIVKRISSVPKQVDRFFTGGVRGELYMTKTGFELHNKERTNRGLRIHKNSTLILTNLARRDGFFCPESVEFHGFLINGWIHLDTQMETIRKLEKLGINRRKDGFLKVFYMPDDYRRLCKYVMNQQMRRDEFESNIDGLVIKANLLTTQKTGKKIVAFKYLQNN
jgi:NAD-dependent DNA ligase